MTAQARRRREYRAGIHRLVVAGDLDERIRALAGTAACVSCTMVFPLPDLDEARICNLCRTRTRSKSHQRDLSRSTPQLEPHVVYVDASWRDGVAGLAIVGELGSFSDQIYTRSNVEAEVMTLRWAMNIAKRRRVSPLVFRTDSESAQRMGARAVPKWADWSVEWIPRRQNMVADQIATQARLAA